MAPVEAVELETPGPPFVRVYVDESIMERSGVWLAGRLGGTEAGALGGGTAGVEGADGGGGGGGAAGAARPKALRAARSARDGAWPLTGGALCGGGGVRPS